MIFLRQLPVVPVIVFVLSPIAAGMEAQAGTVSVGQASLRLLLPPLLAQV